MEVRHDLCLENKPGELNSPQEGQKFRSVL